MITLRTFCPNKKLNYDIGHKKNAHLSSQLIHNIIPHLGSTVNSARITVLMPPGWLHRQLPPPLLFEWFNQQLGVNLLEMSVAGVH